MCLKQLLSEKPVAPFFNDSGTTKAVICVAVRVDDVAKLKTALLSKRVEIGNIMAVGKRQEF
jgi:hypothetical protein